MTNQYFTNACTVGHAYPVDYFHGISSKTTAYIRNNATLHVLLGLRKRTSKTFFVALAKTYAGYCFAVNIYYSCNLKLQITMDRILPFLTMSAQSRFSALPQLRHSPNFPYTCGILGTLGCGTLGTQDPGMYTRRGTLGTLDPEGYTERGTLETQDPAMYT